MTRRICYVTGTRADFGLMENALRKLQAHPDVELTLVVTGMHLVDKYGATVKDIEAAGFVIAARIAVDMDPPTGETMAKNIGLMVCGFVEHFTRHKPELVLLLGDRGEMLAAAIAAIHLNIPITHIHGGERSGTVDEPVRHAISKLAHLHFVATAESRDRLVRMGELAEHVHIVGAPGLDGLDTAGREGRQALMREVGLDPARPVALLVYHPVLQEALQAEENTKTLLDSLLGRGVQVMALMPNADAGSDGIRRVLREYEAHSDIALATHLPRLRFISWMAVADMLVGNSSSGIIEAASFGTPVINIGSRQNLRERNVNVIDVNGGAADIETAVGFVLANGRYPVGNVYGDGRAGERIVGLLTSLELSQDMLRKSNAY